MVGQQVRHWQFGSSVGNSGAGTWQGQPVGRRGQPSLLKRMADPAPTLYAPPTKQPATWPHLVPRPNAVLFCVGGGGPLSLQQKLLDLRCVGRAGVRVSQGWWGCGWWGAHGRRERILEGSSSSSSSSSSTSGTAGALGLTAAWYYSCPQLPCLDKHDLKGRDVDAVVHVVGIRVDAAVARVGGDGGGVRGGQGEGKGEEGWCDGAGLRDAMLQAARLNPPTLHRTIQHPGGPCRPAAWPQASTRPHPAALTPRCSPSATCRASPPPGTAASGCRCC